MRTLNVDVIRDTVRELCVQANHEIREDQIAALERGLAEEQSPLGCQVISQLLENATVAARERVAFCQDTGYAVIFLELGQDVRLTGGSLTEAINVGVAEGYREGYLRASLVKSPIDRVNTGDNTPAMIYTNLVEGDGVKLTVLIKGAGCDNMSAIRMLTPAQGVEGMVDFVVETIKKAGPSASPPVTVGIGMGGTFDKAAVMAKWALTRTAGEPSPNPEIAELERRIRQAINDTGIGPAGFGGTVTALSVHVESMATHIAAFPVAINLDCHSHRVREIEL
ncbi:fumarate hydratase [Microbacterium trichothecenolyticum]|uniref:fumarate hydratase n=1 Tax=Microbacterium trichothecenolyticum TaxID=69370 RepID=UPI001C6F5727|nr:fumarate hydratase [Microbacterium trichothecenolyticum]MBW9122318.1 fumarate hydratase [Microbacterium trichothecenolyticum]